MKKSFLLIALFATQLSAQSIVTPGITTQGEGIVTAVPDTTTITLAVVTEHKTAASALEANNAAVTKVLGDVRAFSVDKKDVKTSRFEISANRIYPRDQPAKLTGYTVTSRLEIIVRNMGHAGKLLDALVNDGANRVDNVAFDFSNSRALLDQAREEAVKDAKRRAEIMAKAAGANLGPLLSLSEVETSTPRPLFSMLEAKAAPSAVPLEPGQQGLKVTVNAVWGVSR